MYIPVKFYAEVCVLYGTVFAATYGFKMCSNHRQRRHEDKVRQMIDDAILKFKHTAGSLVGKVLSSIENDAKKFAEDFPEAGKQFSEEAKNEGVAVMGSFDRLSGNLCMKLLSELGSVRTQVAGGSNETVYVAMEKSVNKIICEETQKMYVGYVDICRCSNDRLAAVKKRLTASQE